MLRKLYKAHVALYHVFLQSLFTQNTLYLASLYRFSQFSSP